MKKIIFIAFCGVWLTACSKEKVVFEKTVDLKNATWTYADTLDFAFDIADTMALYDMTLQIRHRADYGFQNIYVQIFTKFPTGERIAQPLNFDLADATGKWLGKGSGASREFEVNIQENAFFNQAGRHVVTLAQFMRSESLAGIERIRFKLVDKNARRDLAAEEKRQPKRRN